MNQVCQLSREEMSKPQRTVGFGAFLVILIALVLVVAFAGYIYYTDMDRYNTLQQGYAQQGQLIASLSSNLSALASQYEAIASNFSSLQNQYHELQLIVNLQKNQTIASNKAIYMVANGYDSIDFESPHAGYIQVQISATAPISLLLTNYKYGITLDYPTAGTSFQSASFVLPVLDGMNYLQLFGPSSSSVTITVNATLFY